MPTELSWAWLDASLFQGFSFLGWCIVAQLLQSFLLALTSIKPNLTNLEISGYPTTIPSIIQAQNVKIITNSWSLLFLVSTWLILCDSYFPLFPFFFTPASYLMRCSIKRTQISSPVPSLLLFTCSDSPAAVLESSSFCFLSRGMTRDPGAQRDSQQPFHAGV